MTAAATLVCAASATPAHAQGGGGGGAFDNPVLEDEFPGANGSQRTPTPEPTASPTPTPTATPSATPTAVATATVTPRPRRNGAGGDLPNTGSDPLRVGLMGLTLLGFGISLRLRVTDARRAD